MAQDRNGNNHKAAGRSDGGQFDRKAGQGSNDDLDLDMVDARRRVFADMRRNGVDSTLDRYVD